MKDWRNVDRWAGGVATAVVTISFFLAVWSSTNIYLRLVGVMLLLVMLGLNVQSKISLRHLILMVGTLLVLSITSVLFMDWQPSQEVIDLPGAMPSISKYDPTRYIPTAEGLLRQNFFLLHSALAAFLASFLLFGKPQQEGLFLKAIRIILAINVTFWFVQFALYHIAGYALEIFPAGRYLARTASGSVFRGPGIFNEPGTYACSIFPLISMLYLKTRRIDWLQGIAVASMLLSFSTFGWLLGVGFIVVAVPWNKTFVVRGTGLFAFIGLLFGNQIADYIMFKFFTTSRVSWSWEIKVYAWRFWLEQDWLRKALGNWGVNDCKCLYQDSTTLFSLINEYGVLALGAIILLFLKVKGDSKAQGLLALTLLGKLSLGNPVLPLFIVFIAYLGYAKIAAPSAAQGSESLRAARSAMSRKVELTVIR